MPDRNRSPAFPNIHSEMRFSLFNTENGSKKDLYTGISKGTLGYNSSVPFPHTNDPFPSVSKWREDHFHSRNGCPTERPHFFQTGPKHALPYCCCLCFFPRSHYPRNALVSGVWVREMRCSYWLEYVIHI